MKRVIGIVQPSYVPWLPFFERMAIADVFVYLDDVQYSKNSFYNRNAIKGSRGERVLLTVPVQYRGHSRALINEIQIDNNRPWHTKHWRTIQMCYARAPFFERYKEKLEQLYAQPYEKLIDVQLPFIELIRRELNITTPCFLSSEIAVEGSGNEKLVNICKRLGGTHFIVKPGTEHYHPAKDFESCGLQLYRWQATDFVYPQLHGRYEPRLSALDFVLNCEPARSNVVYA